MGALIAIIEALGGLTGPITQLIKDVIALWNDYHQKTGVDPNQVANAALGAAQAFTTLDGDVKQAIADTTDRVLVNNPQMHVAHGTAVAALAVHKVHADLAAKK